MNTSVELKQYTDKFGRVGDISDIEDSPAYDGKYHRQFEAEMKLEKLRDKINKPKDITDYEHTN